MAPFDERAEKELDLGGGVTMKLVLIPPGEFMMGSPSNEKYRARDEGPQHRVKITEPFYMGVTEVTQEQWQTVIDSDPWSGEVHGGRSKDGAANYISWNEATEFCRKLSQKTGQTVRLPTEAEWEHACRAGSTTAYCFGDSAHRLGEYAWYEDNAEDAGKDYPQRGAEKKPNAWGLYDMHGNVWEWCQDWYESGYYGKSPASDPPGAASGNSRVLRGGCWSDRSSSCRLANRNYTTPTDTLTLYGFRVVVSAAGGNSIYVFGGTGETYLGSTEKLTIDTTDPVELKEDGPTAAFGTRGDDHVTEAPGTVKMTIIQRDSKEVPGFGGYLTQIMRNPRGNRSRLHNL